ncbi:MAG: PEGA domain-containing protein [Methanoregula sp.]|nr:MAG: PEGA domain-containing protein [Methanoregula sp.]
MNKHLFRFLFALLFAFLLCGAVQATILELTVLDNVDNTSVSHATVFVDGSNVGRTNNIGQYYITRSETNDIMLRVSMSGFDDWSSVVKSNVTSLTVNLIRKSLKLNVNVHDSDTLSPIPDAEIIITAENTTSAHKTDASGTAMFNVMGATLYAIEIRSTNYQTRTGTVEISSSDVSVQYALMSGNRFSFVVKDQDDFPIENAEVRIDNVLAGKTDPRGILTTKVGRGKTYTIEVKKDGYQPYVITRSISDTDELLTVAMSKAPVGAFIYVVDESKSPVNDADVYLNGERAGSTNQYGRYMLSNVVVGSFTVEVRKNGLVTTQKQINVTKQGDEFTLELPFETVDLKVFVQDKDQKVVPDAAILVNNDKRGVTDDHGQIITKVKLNSVYNVSAVKEGYQSQSVQKEIKQSNETPTLTLTLEKNLDWGFIGLVVAGALGVLLIFGIIRIGRSKKRHHIIRRNEI